MKVILGMGCDRGTPIQTLEAAIDLALGTIDLPRSAINAQWPPSTRKMMKWLCWRCPKNITGRCNFFTAKQLARVEVPNPSEVVRKYMGTPAVSEAAALLAADTDMSDLLVEKFKHRGRGWQERHRLHC